MKKRDKWKNCVTLLADRQFGYPLAKFSKHEGCCTELKKLAEDKCAFRDGQESTCQLPRTPRSTLLMAFSPDGTKLASTHGDHNIYITDIRTGHCLKTLEGHPRTPWCIAFHPTSNDLVASGCLGGEVRVWDLHGGSEIWMSKQNCVIASLAFHPFDQVLVFATSNEIYFWDWNKSQPFAKCKTASEKEKVRYVSFDTLGHKFITGIANLPVISSRSESTRTFPARFASVIEHYNRVLETRREVQRPAATPTQIDALQSAQNYAREVTSSNRRRRLSELSSPSPSSGPAVDPSSSADQSWRYRDPFSLRDLTTRPSLSGRTPSGQSEMLPSSLIQALVRLQRSLEILTQTRLNAVSDYNSYEQVHLRERIEEILSRLFNLYASITPLRILMNEVFQDLDRESLMAEVNQEGTGTTLGNPDLDNRLQELRQQLSRLLERVYSSESQRNLLFSGEVPSPPQHLLFEPCRGRGPRAAPTSSSSDSVSSSSISGSSESSGPSTSASNQNSVSSEENRFSIQLPRQLDQQSRSLSIPDLNLPSTSSTTAWSQPLSTGESSFHFPSSGGTTTTTTSSSSTLTSSLLSRLQRTYHLNFDVAPSRPAARPRSPPLPTMVNHSSQLQYVDYQAANNANNNNSNDRNNGGTGAGSQFLHPNYIASLFDENVQRNNASQLVFNRDVARTFLGASDFAVVNNVMSLTHRIQCWDFSRFQIPDISNCQVNVVVSECKIHNDASVDISSDGRLLATLVPENVRFTPYTVVAVYSLEKHNLGLCMYKHMFNPNAISVSLSPLNRYILIGFASRRVIVCPNDKQVIAQIFKLKTFTESGKDNMELVRVIQQTNANRVHMSVNSTRWLPGPGEGLVYGTNRGDLRICRPGPPRTHDDSVSGYWLPLFARQQHLSGLLPMQSTSTQTLSPQTQSAGTQTGMDMDE